MHNSEEYLPVDDPKYIEALDLVITKGQCSISLVQRYLRIDYHRAGRIVEQMEHEGVVTPPGSGGVRKVLVQNLDGSIRNVNKWYAEYVLGESGLKDTFELIPPEAPLKPKSESISNLKKLLSFLGIIKTSQQEYESQYKEYLASKANFEKLFNERKEYVEKRAQAKIEEERNEHIDFVYYFAPYLAREETDDILDTQHLSSRLGKPLDIVKEALVRLNKDKFILPFKDKFRININSSEQTKKFEELEDWIDYESQRVERCFLSDGVYPCDGCQGAPPFFKEKQISYLKNIGLIDKADENGEYHIDPTSDGYKQYKELTRLEKREIAKRNKALTPEDKIEIAKQEAKREAEWEEQYKIEQEEKREEDERQRAHDEKMDKLRLAHQEAIDKRAERETESQKEPSTLKTVAAGIATAIAYNSHKNTVQREKDMLAELKKQNRLLKEKSKKSWP